MSIPSTPAEQHRSVAATFGQRVAGVGPDLWGAPTPVPEWTVSDVVDHLIAWFSGFLSMGSDVSLPEGPPVAADPVAAWDHRVAAVQALLDDPSTADRSFALPPHVPETPLAVAIARFYTADVFMHTWDLARATGQDDRLDENLCRALYEGMLPLDAALRQSGQYGPRVPVPDDASWQDRLLGYIGRDPAWRPAVSGAG